MGDELLTRYKACMVLSGVGDAIGYKNQQWEYCESGPQIHAELAELGGLDHIKAELPDWPVSDDTVMHLAVAEGLTCGKTEEKEIFLEIARKYKECMNDMEGRGPGPTSMKGCDQLDPTKPDGYIIPFNPTGSGCGAAMRSMCLGLRFPRPEDEPSLIAYSVEAGRMTHHHPTGFLGSLASALFVAYSVRGKPIESWGRGLLDILPKALDYVEAAGISVEENKQSWAYFTDKWTTYLESRGISDGSSQPKFPDNYDDPAVRDKVYKTFSLEYAGRSGHDAPMIAYDGLMAAGKNWHEMSARVLFHGGDSDSTGVIGAACYGAMYGYHGVPECNYSHLEYRKRLEEQGEKLYHLAQQK